MIIKGKSRKNACQAGRYLLKKGVNDRVEMIEIKGVVAVYVRGAMQEIDALAKGTRCEKPIYHGSINIKKEESLTQKQWKQAVNLLEKYLGFEGHQRVVVEHEKRGRVHWHIIWNRINPYTMKAVHMSKNFMNHEKTARLLEKEFNLEKVIGVHVLEMDEKPAGRGPTKYEITESGKTGVNIYEWREAIRQIGVGEKGTKFIAALNAQGHIVTKGNKVAFMILDPIGAAHRMAQSLGVKVNDLMERLSDVDPASLPSVEQAQVRQKEKIAEIEITKSLEEDSRKAQVDRAFGYNVADIKKEVLEADHSNEQDDMDNNLDLEDDYDLDM